MKFKRGGILHANKLGVQAPAARPDVGIVRHGHIFVSFRRLTDAYTYFFRGKVYANAQTGNIVLLSQHLFAGDFLTALHYLIPLVAFASGILAAELFREHFQSLKALHWRQMIVLAEILLLFSVGFFPQELNLLANAIVSFSCAMQVQTFRKVSGYAYASTMCIGNMRGGMEALAVWIVKHDPKALRKVSHYFGIIFLFGVGAGLGWVAVEHFATRAIWVVLPAAGHLLRVDVHSGRSGGQPRH